MIQALFVFAVLGAPLPGERIDLQVSDYVDRAVDCVARKYGARSAVMCDLAPGTQRAVAACKAMSSEWAGDNNVPCRIEAPNGLFYWGSTVEVCNVTDLDFHGAKLLTKSGVTPIRFLGFGACRAAGWSTAGRSSLRNVLMQPFAATGTTARAYGVEAFAPIHLEDVHLIGFTQGVRIIGFAKATPTAGR